MGDMPPEMAATVTWLEVDAAKELGGPSRPVGFAKACNLGLQKALADGEPYVGAILINDDAVPAAGWLDGLREAFEPEHVRLWGGDQEDGKPVPVPTDELGPVGIVGPVTNRCAGIQQVKLGPEDQQRAAQDSHGFAGSWRASNPGAHTLADFISGFCMAISTDCLRDLGQPSSSTDGRFKLLDEGFGIGGYEDNELCARAAEAGWRCVVAGDTFVYHRGHRTLDRHFPGQNRGLANLPKYLKPVHQKKSLVACYRWRPQYLNDFHMMRGSLFRTAEVADGIAILVTANPLEMTKAYDVQAVHRTLAPEDQRLLQACSNASPKKVAKAVKRWVGETLARVKDSREPEVRVRVWDCQHQERDERNAALALAEGMGPDWILVVEPCEALEPRVDRPLLDQLMAHPDPLVQAYDLSVLIMWSQDMWRADPPWTGPGYTGAPGGVRLFKVHGETPNQRRIIEQRRIMDGDPQTGDGCSCAPHFGPMAVRVANVRLFDFGLVRKPDREIEFQRTGGAHLTREECATLSPIVAQNGIGFTMLVHGGERPEDVGRWLDNVHGLTDAAVLVWTDPWDEDRQGSGPSADLQRIASCYGALWVRKELQECRSFAECRNAGLEALRFVGRPIGLTGPAAAADDGRPLGWAFVADPDEWFGSPWAEACALRRMADCSDSYGFMFRFWNHRPDGGLPNVSETIRFIRLDPDGVMRYEGRVHETFDVALAEVRDRLNWHPTIRAAPFQLHNRGTALPDTEAEAKLRFYDTLLLDELRDRPTNSGAWVSLALSYENEGRDQDALICLERGFAVAGKDSYLAVRELAWWHLRRARILMSEASKRVSPGHPFQRFIEEAYKWLSENAADVPRIGLARTGDPQPDACPDLPPFDHLMVQDESEVPASVDDNGRALLQFGSEE